MKLSILIPSLISRAEQLNILRQELNRQAIDYAGKVEILTYTDNGEESIGRKRNELLDRAYGEYVCFIDDDDEVSKDYISKVMEAIKWTPDCCSLIGCRTVDGENPEIFEHSIRYKEYKTNKVGAVTYERYPNHLNVIKSSIAKKFRFPEISYGEDTDWATQIFESGLLKQEIEIKGVIYHYQFKSNK